MLLLLVSLLLLLLLLLSCKHKLRMAPVKKGIDAKATIAGKPTYLAIRPPRAATNASTVVVQKTFRDSTCNKTVLSTPPFLVLLLVVVVVPPPSPYFLIISYRKAISVPEYMAEPIARRNCARPRMPHTTPVVVVDGAPPPANTVDAKAVNSNEVPKPKKARCNVVLRPNLSDKNPDGNSASVTRAL